MARINVAIPVDSNNVALDVLGIIDGKMLSIIASSSTATALEITATNGRGVLADEQWICTLTPDADIWFKQGASDHTVCTATNAKKLKSGAEYMILVEPGINYYSAKAVANATTTLNLSFHGRGA